jgi:transcriptional regulator with XRE-family HTH domain
VNAAGSGSVGEMVRAWRERRRLSQLDLAMQAEISTRHLSFVETGRSQPSREMIVRLSEQLALALDERNRLLLAAGFAPLYRRTPLEAPSMAPVREAVRRILSGHEPYPAVAVDPLWNLLDGNAAVAVLTEGVAPELLEPPVNGLRVTLHPNGMAPSILNLAQWRKHLLSRLRYRVAASRSDEGRALLAELESYPGGETRYDEVDAIAVPLRLHTSYGELRFYSAVTTFGGPLDVALEELALEAFYPADEATASILWARAATG